MFTLLPTFQSARRVTKLSWLIELTRCADELLMSSKLSRDTRQQLQQKRDDLEQQIRALQAA